MAKIEQVGLIMQKRNTIKRDGTRTCTCTCTWSIAVVLGNLIKHPHLGIHVHACARIYTYMYISNHIYTMHVLPPANGGEESVPELLLQALHASPDGSSDGPDCRC